MLLSTLATPIAANVVACSKVDYRVNDKGNSAFWFLPKLNGSGAQADSSDVWSEMDPFAKNKDNPNQVIKNPAAWNTDQRNALGMKILQMLSVALLIDANQAVTNPNDPNNPFNYVKQHATNYANLADYNKLLSNLQIGWKTLDSSVDQEIANKKQSYKDQYGDSKWQSHWNDMLNDSYDGSEQKYKADLLTSSTTLNASTVLTNALLGGTTGFDSIDSSTIQNYAAEYQKAQDKSEWIKDNIGPARDILLGYTGNPYSNSLWGKDQSDSLTYNGGTGDVNPTSLNNALTSTKPPVGVPIATYDATTTKYVRTNNNYQNISSTGVLSQFQNYALNKYYQDEKPLAVSTYQEAYDATPGGEASHKGLEYGANKQDFGYSAEGEGKSIDNIDNILNASNWNSLSAAGITTKPQKKMVTLNPDSSITPEMETAVYGSMQTLVKGYQAIKEGGTAGQTALNNLPIIQAKNLIPAGKKIDQLSTEQKGQVAEKLIDAINRSKLPSSTGDNPPLKTDVVAPTAAGPDSSSAAGGTIGQKIPQNLHQNNMYAVVQLGSGPHSSLAVAYLDDKGLNFANVDGLQQSVNASLTGKKKINPKQISPQTPSTSNPQWTNEAQNKDWDNFQYNIKPQLGSTIKNADGSIGTPSSKTFNNEIYNPYLQYLVNQSYFNTNPKTSGSTSSFNIMDDLKSFADLKSGSKVGDGSWYTWVYSFFNNYFTKANDKNWLEQLVKISPDATDGDSWFKNFVNSNLSTINSSLDNLYKTIATLNKTIQGKDEYYAPRQFNESISDWENYFNPNDPNSNLSKFWTMANKWQGE